MNGRTVKLALVLIIVCTVGAWTRAGATGAADCCNLISQCSQMTDAQLLSAAFLSSAGFPTHLGMCYYHDKSTCPNCARDLYVKISTMPDPSGYDGGTGGLPLGSTLTDVARILRQLCENGSCCCPQKTPSSSCPTLGTPVWAQDPVTKNCCQYSNACLAPTGWSTFPTESECRGKTSSVDP